MSAGIPGRGAGRGRGPGRTRAVRIATGIFLILIVLVAVIWVLRRYHADPAGGQSVVKKAPLPPGDRNSLEAVRPRPAAAEASSSPREGNSVVAETRGNAEVGTRKPGDRQLPGPDRGAPSPPLVLDEGELRIFIDGTGTVSLPVVVRETGTRIIVESAGDRRPAEVLIAAVPDGTAAVSVLSGAVGVAVDGRRVRVGAGTFVTVASGAPPALPEALPPPPDLAAPSDDAVFLYGTLPPRISFSWRARGAADGFRFVLARDREFRQVVLDERVTDPRVTQGSLEEGTFFWRVSAVRKGATGPPGDAARLRIARRATPPDLELSPATRGDGGNVRLVTGRTEPGVKIFVSGNPVPVTATGSFSCRLRLDRTVRAIVVEAVDPLGNVAYRSQWVP